MEKPRVGILGDSLSEGPVKSQHHYQTCESENFEMTPVPLTPTVLLKLHS